MWICEEFCGVEVYAIVVCSACVGLAVRLDPVGCKGLAVVEERCRDGRGVRVCLVFLAGKWGRVLVRRRPG